MKWIEQIKVQIPINQMITVNQVLNNIVDSLQENEENLRIQVCENAKVSTEIIICFHWNTEYKESGGSKEGNTVQQLLAKYGMVHHSSWLITH